MNPIVAGKTTLSQASLPPELSGELPKNTTTRRHSSRISTKTSHESELNSLNTSQSSYSLPSTPLTSSFDDPLHTTKRRKTLRNSSKPLLVKDDKTTTTPQTSDSASKSRDIDAKSSKMNGINGHVSNVAMDQTLFPQTSNGGCKSNGQSKIVAKAPSAVENSQTTTLDSLPSPQVGQGESLHEQGSPKEASGPKGSRGVRKSLSAKVKDFARKFSRQSRGSAAGTPELPRASSQPAPPTSGPSPDNSRPKSSQSVDIHNLEAKAQTKPDVPTPTGLSPLPKDVHNADGNAQGSPVSAFSDGSSFDFDGRDSFGLDGQMDLPASSAASVSTTVSAGVRTSGRTRKPTVRALESLESQQRLRRAKPNAKKAETSASGGAKGKSATPQEGNSNSPLRASQSGSQQKSDLEYLYKRLFEAAVAALAPNLKQPLDGEAILDELRKEFNSRKAKKAQDAQQLTAKNDNEKVVFNGTKLGGSKHAGESRPSPSKTFLLQNHLQTAKPWTDEDGWTHIGRINGHGEEMVVVPEGYEWYRPNNTYGDGQLPVPPIRVKSSHQAEKDRIFGYPPRIGERNIPRESRSPFMVEDVEIEKAKIKAREEARKRDIVVHSSMTLDELRGLIRHHDQKAAMFPQFGLPTFEPERSDAPAERTRKRRREEPVDAIGARKTDSLEPQWKRRRQPMPRNPFEEAPTTTTTTPATINLFTKTTIAKTSPTKGKKRTLERDDAPVMQQRPTKKLKLIITRPGMRRDLTTSTTDTNGKRNNSTTNTTAKTQSTANTQSAALSQPTATSQPTAQNGDQTANGSPGGRPRRRAAAAAAAATAAAAAAAAAASASASAANSQPTTRTRKTNTRKRKAADSAQPEDQTEVNDEANNQTNAE